MHFCYYNINSHKKVQPFEDINKQNLTYHYILCQPVRAPVTSRSLVHRLTNCTTQVDKLNTNATSLGMLFHESAIIEV